MPAGRSEVRGPDSRQRAFVPLFLLVQLLPINGLAMSALAEQQRRRCLSDRGGSTHLRHDRSNRHRGSRGPQRPRCAPDGPPDRRAVTLRVATCRSSDDRARVVFGAHTSSDPGRGRDEVSRTISASAVVVSRGCGRTPARDAASPPDTSRGNAIRRSRALSTGRDVGGFQTRSVAARSGPSRAARSCRIPDR